jgi:phosphoglycerol transferase MdoB-like AlkP superfamily enzyme
MRMKDFMIERGYKTQDSSEHMRLNDDALFELLEQEVLPGLAADSSPFVLLILNSDTHPDFLIGEKCDDFLIKESYPRVYRSFTCFDQHLESFVRTMERLGLDKTTEVIIYGDHLTMGSDVHWMLSAERNLTVFMPLRAQDEKWAKWHGKPLSYYDFAPTVMELLEIDYSPPFPFGTDMLGDEVGRVASLDDLKLIYGIATGDIDYSTARCLGSAGFCQSDEY